MGKARQLDEIGFVALTMDLEVWIVRKLPCRQIQLERKQGRVISDLRSAHPLTLAQEDCMNQQLTDRLPHANWLRWADEFAVARAGFHEAPLRECLQHVLDSSL